MSYEEHLPVDALNATAVDSEATVLNTEVSGSLEYGFSNQFFIGAKGSMPVVEGDDSETWTGLGGFQNNNLKYRWSRVDVYAGYSFGAKEPEFTEESADTFAPYIGIRSSWARQKRSDFTFLGLPVVKNAVTEKVNSYGTVVGLRVQRSFAEAKFSIGLNAEGAFPFNVEATNSDFPGAKFDSVRGYTFRIGGFGEYKISKHWFVGLDGYGGMMHWEGSDWQAYGGTFIKWPENDTTYYGGNLSAKYKF
jgi:hypothetical protein